jgi:DNA-binding response OmpR family regulator
VGLSLAALKNNQRRDMEHVINAGKRVLVVEDEPVIARIFKEILTADGFSVEVAANGNIARDMVMKEAFDLCILNIHIPGINGIKLYKFLQKERPVLSSKTLFTTGDILSGDTEAFLKEANRPLLLKPFTPDELRTVVRDAMNQAMS